MASIDCEVKFRKSQLGGKKDEESSSEKEESNEKEVSDLKTRREDRDLTRAAAMRPLFFGPNSARIQQQPGGSWKSIFHQMRSGPYSSPRSRCTRKSASAYFLGTAITRTFISSNTRSPIKRRIAGTRASRRMDAHRGEWKNFYRTCRICLSSVIFIR